MATQYRAAMLRAVLDPRRWPLPGGCQICLAWGQDRLCRDCVTRFAPALDRCPRCALVLRAGACPDCLREPLPLDATVAAVDYAAPWDGLVHGLKYHARLSAGMALADLLAAAVRRSGVAMDGVQLLPVPLHPQRLAERGHNQAHEIARHLSRALGLRLPSPLVQRLADTPSQALAPDRQTRQQRLREAFALRAGASVAGQHWALVDDVMTTGATMSALAALLRRHGAASVQAWCVARTPRPTD
jgi:ComF family protein